MTTDGQRNHFVKQQNLLKCTVGVPGKPTIALNVWPDLGGYVLFYYLNSYIGLLQYTSIGVHYGHRWSTKPLCQTTKPTQMYCRGTREAFCYD